MTAHRLAAGGAACFLAASMFSHSVALRLLLLAGTAALLVVAAMQNRAAIRFLPPLWLAYTAWAAWAALSLAWSIDVERSLKEFRNEILYAALAFWACFAAAQARGAARIVLPVVGLAAATACGFAFYSYTRGWEQYLVGRHGGPGDHSSALLVLMPCAVATAWYTRRAAWPTACQVAPVLLAAIFLAAAWAAQSRTFWLALAAQVLSVTLLVAMRPPARLKARRTAMAALVAAAVVLAAAAMTLQVQSAREGTGARALHQDPRFPLWTEVAEKIQEKPWTGYGFGRGMLRGGLRDELKDVQLWHAHNLFLDTALQLGLPGVALLLALLAATLREGWRLARDPSPAAAACGAALVAVVVGMLARNMTDVLLVRQNALLYWGAIGVLLAWGAGQRASLAAKAGVLRHPAG